MELDELINLLNREHKDYVKINFTDQLNNELISITTTFDGGCMKEYLNKLTAMVHISSCFHLKYLSTKPLMNIIML